MLPVPESEPMANRPVAVRSGHGHAALATRLRGVIGCLAQQPELRGRPADSFQPPGQVGRDRGVPIKDSLEGLAGYAQL